VAERFKAPVLKSPIDRTALSSLVLLCLILLDFCGSQFVRVPLYPAPCYGVRWQFRWQNPQREIRVIVLQTSVPWRGLATLPGS
jgi:hypothetical protein